MKLKETTLNCQIPSLEHMAEQSAQLPSASLSKRLKLQIRRSLGPAKERTFKNYTNKRINRFCQLTGRETKPASPLPKVSSVKLLPGDWVRIRSLEEIKATLNHWKQVKGCGFMPEMAEFCNTIHRVYKCMNHFVDERDALVKKSNGIILLEGVLCQGAADFGRCDRSCFHFWREEWLEKIDEVNALSIKDISHPGCNGNKVRVLPLSEIEATLDKRMQLKGCAFMPEMAEFCGTTQRVLKRLNRFVDERDLQVKKTSGVVLLNGIVCEGIADLGSCDRACFYYWREEWLEPADKKAM
jgi:hypothetical protein